MPFKSNNNPLSVVSYNKESFDKAAPFYQKALNNSGYTNLSTNIGRTFLKMLDAEFTEEHVLHKVFNRNTMKISYSCIPNLKQNIDGHNKSILHKKIVPPRSCNCRVKTECHMSGNSLKESVVYQASVSTEDHHLPQTYVELTENSFKTRYSNHKSLFANANRRNNTELSKYICYLKENLTKFKVTWRILKHALSYCTTPPLTGVTYASGRSILLFANLI